MLFSFVRMETFKLVFNGLNQEPKLQFPNYLFWEVYIAEPQKYLKHETHFRTITWIPDTNSSQEDHLKLWFSINSKFLHRLYLLKRVFRYCKNVRKRQSYKLEWNGWSHVEEPSSGQLWFILAWNLYRNCLEWQVHCSLSQSGKNHNSFH